MTDETTPFSMIPSHFPQQEEKLLSDWPAELTVKKSYRPRPIDQEIINSMNVIEKIGYAPKPVNMKKFQLPYIIPNEFGDENHLTVTREGVTPQKYRPVEMTFAHLPSEDRQSEIQKYNTTKFVGLEPHIPNTYCNNMLQVPSPSLFLAKDEYRCCTSLTPWELRCKAIVRWKKPICLPS